MAWGVFFYEKRTIRGVRVDFFGAERYFKIRRGAVHKW
jgi:hypothetical protein